MHTGHLAAAGPAANGTGAPGLAEGHDLFSRDGQIGLLAHVALQRNPCHELRESCSNTGAVNHFFYGQAGVLGHIAVQLKPAGTCV